MIFGEYDREMDIAVNRREEREETRKETRNEERQYFIELLDQGLTKDEIKERLKQFGDN